MPPPEPTHTYMSAPTGPDPRVQQLENEKKGIIEEANKRHLIMLIICGALALALTISLIFHIVGGDDKAAPVNQPAGGNSQVVPTIGTGSATDPTGTADPSNPSDPTGETEPPVTEPVETHKKVEATITDGGKNVFVDGDYKVTIVETTEKSLKANISWQKEVAAPESGNNEGENDTSNGAAGISNDGNSQTAVTTPEPITEEVTLTVNWSDGLSVSCDASKLVKEDNNQSDDTNTSGKPEYKYCWQYQANDNWMVISGAGGNELTQLNLEENNFESGTELRCVITVKNEKGETVLELVLGGIKLIHNEDDNDYVFEFPAQKERLEKAEGSNVTTGEEPGEPAGSNGESQNNNTKITKIHIEYKEK